MKLHRRKPSVLAAATLAALPGIGSSASAAGVNGMPASWLPSVCAWSACGTSA